MTYFVTGATGFIGRHLVAELLHNRQGDVHVLVRPESRSRLDTLIAGAWGGTDRIKPVSGDLLSANLGASDEWIADNTGKIEHFFHLAALYDMTAPDELNERVNVQGTHNAVELAAALDARHLHHMSSVAVSGDYRGTFREDMFDEGQNLPSPYHRTKFESERIVRDQAIVPWRVYRPSIVVGHSMTGEIDKIDGPYYFFKALQRAGRVLPEWLPLLGPDLGWTNIVPVDFVAAATDHIAHRRLGDGRAFHLMAPKSERSTTVLNTFARSAHAPGVALSLNVPFVGRLPGAILSPLLGVAPVRDVRRVILAEAGLPEEIIAHTGFSARFDTRAAQEALSGSGIEVPKLDTYSERLWSYWEHHLDPDRYRNRPFTRVINGKTVLLTGASSGIGKAAAKQIAAAGGIPLLVARNADKLEETRQEIMADGGTAHTYSCDLSDLDAIEGLVAEVLNDHPAVDVLVNNAGRSIRRSIALSLDRFHDFQRTMQLNYFGAIRLTMLLLPHMRERGGGHVVNISSIGVQANPPRFSAYVASKAALDAWTRVVSSEVIGDGVTFTTIHMPLVRTEMIAPTKMYDQFPTITPEEAGGMICEAIRSKPKTINTRLGTVGEVAYALSPKAVDRILHVAYRVFPDSAAARGVTDDTEQATAEQVAMAKLMPGVHW